MVGRDLRRSRRKHQPSAINQFEQELSIMNYLEGCANRAIFLTQGVEAVRISGHDAVELASSQQLDVVVSKHLEEALFAGAANVVTAVLLGVIKNTEIYAGEMQ